MEKRMIFLLITTITILLLNLYSVNALIISEIESNPDGKDYKNEWIELFSPIEINDEYILVNNDAGEVYDNEDENQLKIKFNFVGYYIYNFNGQWLDNSDEKVYLYNSKGTLIDSTNLFDDGEDSDFTWQRCNDTWIFENQTKGLENCVIEEPEINETEINETETNETEIPEEEETSEDEKEVVEEESEDDEEKNEVIEDAPIEKETTPITGSIIKLDSKDIKSTGNTKELDKSNFATIALGLVVILLLLLLVSQRYKQNKKNEFR